MTAMNRKKNSTGAHLRRDFREIQKQRAEQRKETALGLFEEAVDKLDELQEHLSTTDAGHATFLVERDGVIVALEELLEAAGIPAP